jgi:GNAT superfamily N-acetyltransferase
VTVAYDIEPELSVAEFVDVMRRSTLAERRPLEDPERVARMLGNADLVLTARRGGLLVGVSRAVTDFAYCCYLSDLAVDAALQGSGIGRELIRRTHEAAGLECSLVLLSAPAAMGFYPRAGMREAGNCFVLDRSA